MDNFPYLMLLLTCSFLNVQFFPIKYCAAEEYLKCKKSIVLQSLNWKKAYREGYNR